MTLIQRIYMAAMITPALALTYFGLFACSPWKQMISPVAGFGLALLGAYSCSHLIVIACCIWRDSNK